MTAAVVGAESDELKVDSPAAAQLPVAVQTSLGTDG
jgi:hypothetical protein